MWTRRDREKGRQIEMRRSRIMVTEMNKMNQSTVKFLGDTCDRISVLRGTQSLCATLTEDKLSVEDPN